MAQLLRVQNFNVSSDGFGAGEHQSLERPFGDADPGELFAWTRLGSGVRLWESPDELLDRFHLDVVPSPSGVTHHLFWRR